MARRVQNDNKWGNAASGAATGALAGSMIMPGVGTAVGAAVGGAAGYFSGEKEAIRDVESLRIGPGNAMASYSSDEVGKDYGFSTDRIGGGTTGLAKASQTTLAGVKLAGSVMGGIPSAGGAQEPGGLAQKPQLIETDPLQQTQTVTGGDPLKGVPQIRENLEDDYWTETFQQNKKSLYSNPYNNNFK